MKSYFSTVERLGAALFVAQQTHFVLAYSTTSNALESLASDTQG
jgi:hypothetical protein